MSGNIRRTIIHLFLALGIGVVGIVAGQWIRGRLLREPTGAVVTHTPPPGLRVGQRLPVMVLVSERGDTLSSVDLIEGGAVVLLLDPDCPPCADMARKWQRAIKDRVVDPPAVWAVSAQPADAIRRFKEETAITFPVYRDARETLHRVYDVTQYPLELIVDHTLRIQSTSYDPRHEVNPKVMLSILGAAGAEP